MVVEKLIQGMYLMFNKTRNNFFLYVNNLAALVLINVHNIKQQQKYCTNMISNDNTNKHPFPDGQQVCFAISFVKDLPLKLVMTH